MMEKDSTLKLSDMVVVMMIATLAAPGLTIFDITL